MRRRTFIPAIAAGLVVPAFGALAQSGYPSRPITLVVPFAAGGGGDLVARLIAKELADRTKATVLVDNRVGAGGNIGAASALKSKADGYTLLSMSSTYAIQAAIAKLTFDPIADMQPVVMLAREPGMLIVGAMSPLLSVRDLVTQARAKPGKLTFGSAGAGSSAHVGLEDLSGHLGVQLTHIPYKGTSQAFNDLLAGTIDMMYTSMSHGVPFVRSGQIRALGVADINRSKALPDVATIAEQGATGYTHFDWKAIAVPRGTPPDVIAFLNREVNEVLKQKAIVDRFEAEGSTVVGGSPDQMMNVVRSDVDRWKALSRKINLGRE